MSYINIYKSAFDNTVDTVEVENCTVKEGTQDYNLDYKNCLINVNGFEKDENYFLRENDVCTIRQYPSGTSWNLFKQADSATKARVVFSWILNPIGSLAIGLSTGNFNGANGTSISANSTGVIWGKSAEEVLASVTTSSGNTTNTDPNTTETDGKTIKTNPTISGATNTSAEGKTVPFVMGKHLFAPNWIGRPYHTVAGTDGDTEYLNVLYMLGYAPLKVEDLKLGYFNLASNSGNVTSGSIPLDGEYEDIEIEIQSGDSECSLYNEKVIEETLDEELYNFKDSDEEVHKLELIRLSAKFPRKIEVEFTLEGLVKWDNDGKAQNTSVQVKIEYSFDGINYFNFGAVSGGTYDSTTGITTITRKKAQVMKFCATKDFSTESYATFKQNLSKNYVFLKITRENLDALDDDIIDNIKVSAIRTWCFDKAKSDSQNDWVVQRPVIENIRNNTVRIAMRAKATKDKAHANKETLKEFNAIVTSLGRTWNGSEWSDELSVTQNPASIALLSYQSFMLGKDNQVPDSNIDLEKFGAFYEFCEQKGYKCNGVIISQQKASDLTSAILRTGRAFRVLNGNLESVCFDDRRSIPVNIINNQNCLEASNTKDIEELPDGFVCTFKDENNFYQETEIKVLYDDSKISQEDLKLETISLPYVTDFRQVTKLLKYQLACKKLRREVWMRKMSVDGNLIEIGNLVELQDDTISVGIGDGAEIKDIVIENNYITEIVTDGKFDVDDATKEYGIKILQSDGYSDPIAIKKKVEIDSVGVYSTFVLEEPISVLESVKPTIGDLISFGLYSKITIDAICSSKKENSDGTFNFDFVAYDENIYSAEEGEIPEFDSKVTSPIMVQSSSPQVPSATIAELKSAVDTINNGNENLVPDDYVSVSVNAEKDGLLIICSVDSENLKNEVEKTIYQLSKDGGETWSNTKEIEGRRGYYYFDRDRDLDGYPESDAFATWIVRAKPVNIYGNVAENWVQSLTVIISNYGTWRLTKPTIFEPNATDRTIKLQFAQSPRSANLTQYGNIRYQLQISRNGGSQSPYDQDEYKDIVSGDRVWFKPNTHDNPKAGNTVQQPAVYSTGITEQVGDRVVLKFYENFDSENHTLDTYVDYTDVDPRIVEGELPQYCRPEKSDSAVGYIIVSGEQVNVYSYTYEVIEEGNVDNYKDSNGSTSDTPTESDYLVYDSTYSQTMPLLGQDIRNAVNTDYLFRIRAFNEANVSEWSDVCSTTALCTGIADFVYANETAKSSIVEFLSAISANIGVIKQGAFGDIDNQQNYWVLDDLSATEAGTNRDLKKGEFRVGGENEYFACTPNGDGTFSITLKAGNISLSNTGFDFSSGTYIYDEVNNPDVRLALTAGGIEVHKTSDNWQTWTVISRFMFDKKGNLIIANTDKYPKFAVYEAGSNVYKFDDVVTEDESGSNTQNISVASGYTVESNTLLSDCKVLNGTITDDISNKNTKVVAVTNADKIRIGENVIGIDGKVNTNIEVMAKTIPSGETLSNWGFTSAQCGTIVFEEIQ